MFLFLVSLGLVVSLPMRDGNSPQEGYRHKGCLVVSLPMRDGNRELILKALQEYLKLLAYL